MHETRRLTLADLAGSPPASSETTTVTETSVQVTPKAAPQASGFRKGATAAAQSEKPQAQPGRPATEKQIAFLQKLIAERAPEHVGSDHTRRVIEGGSARVSKAIEQLLAKPKVASAPAPARTNRYPGKCEECGTTVEAEAGLLAKADSGDWEVSHRPGECPATEFPFPVGRYALDTADGTRFYLADTEGFFVQAGDDFHPVAPSAAKVLIEQIAADPEAASRLYGREIGKCGRCNRTLTDAVSRAQGIGPVCSSKGW